jgi:glyoxylase-like metal-dependent hydrolase (beta-lactamase superfamily II)
MSGKKTIEEKDLCDLGIFRIPVPIPFRQAGGPVNAYLIEEEQGFILFDPGLGLEDSQAALAEGVARAGHRFEEISRMIVSHGHIDHFGSAAWVMEQAGHEIPILIHDADAPKVLETGADWPDLLSKNSDYLFALGMPSTAIAEMIDTINKNRKLGRRLNKVESLVPGAAFPCRHVTLEVHHMPGHTPGVCCLYDRDHRILFSADHLLERVSPNPLIELGLAGERIPYKPLLTYFQSIERMRTLEIDLVLPGHAAPFSSPFNVVDSLHSFYQRRQSKILDALQNKPLSAYAIMSKLFPADSGFELFLMLSETLGNLEALEEKGKVIRFLDNGIIHFQLAGW